MRGIMVQGTSSSAGKSFVATALCRIFADKGYKVCPFKSQNMSHFGSILKNGAEISRAQRVQAEAARLEAEVYMNPIMLKPCGNCCSEIILLGKHSDVPGNSSYFREFAMKEGLEAVRSSLKYIDEHYEMIVIEGAGSPAEINLNDTEIVNMRVAREADVPVILVADVNRGGALASVVGTLELLGEDRRRIKGIIYNKFRGDIALFQSAVKWTESYTGVKVLGVLPMLDVEIEEEDSMSAKNKATGFSAQERDEQYNKLAENFLKYIDTDYIIKEIIR